LEPENAATRLHRALGLLRMGDWRQGWPEFEWRLKTPRHGVGNLGVPRWQGQELEGQTVLIVSEQGLGDTLQFVRYLARVSGRGGKVLFACPLRLVELLKSVRGVDRIVPLEASVPGCDFHVPLLSLPLIFDTNLETIPAEVPYLVPDHSRVEKWRARLTTGGGPRVGACWQGNPHHARDRMRSIPVDYFAELCQVPEVQILSLQSAFFPGAGDESTGKPPFRDLVDAADPEAGSFQDVAAVMKSLDVVITCDTSLAHLAGALGVRVWVALDFAADWRWLVDREDSPWYPTMRLFRQDRPGNWQGVFRRIRQALQDLREDLRQR
jgi:hypothetical protein